jgi:hypothetical protein
VDRPLTKDKNIDKNALDCFSGFPIQLN